METPQTTANKECYDKGACGHRCCCGAKAVIVLVILLLGGIVGYLIGASGNAYSHPCTMSMGGIMNTPQ